MDLLRVAALGAVVLGHWLVIDVVYRGGELAGRNVLADVPYTHGLTLLFQAMPVFFLAGGYANATSWSAHRRRGERWQTWLQGRVGGLFWPATAYVGTMTVAVGLLGVTDLDGDILARAGWVLALHLWFLSVYLVLLALTPAQTAAGRRWGLVVAAVLATAAAFVDLVVIGGGVDTLGWASYILVWGCVHQLGVAWQQGHLTRSRAVPVGMAAAGLGVLVGLVAWGPYPLSMVGVPGADVQNTSPPNLALLAFATLVTGLLVTLEPTASRRLESRTRWERLGAANRLAITVYLWHMVPVVVVAATLYRAGLMPQPPAGSAGWWLSRVVWVGALAVLLGVVVASLSPILPLLRRLPSSLGRSSRAAPLLVLAGTAVLSVAVARLAVEGFAPGGRLPVTTLGAYLAGLALVLLAGAPSHTRDRPEVPAEPGSWPPG